MTITDCDSLEHRVITDRATASTLSRRTFLAATLATGILSSLPASRSVASEARKRLVAGTQTLEVNGRAARVYSLIGPDGRPGIRLRAHERFRVDLANQSGKHTLVHWHGQLPPWTQDGFPWPETPPLANGALQSYDYTPIPGTYWMHSHVGMQEQVLMTAPLIVEDEIALREDRQEIVLMLHDFTFRSPGGAREPHQHECARPYSACASCRCATLCHARHDEDGRARRAGYADVWGCGPTNGPQ
jgi:FtsP/CotA-like multicopper oxidase with cupredoxin domain